jgi:cell shape-determining protein MreC
LNKSSTKFLWIYTIVLFAVAFVLILVSAIGQNKATQNVESLQRELEQNKSFFEGAQKSLTDITNENTYLKEENESLKKENDGLKSEMKRYDEEEAADSRQESIYLAVLKAQSLYNQKKYSDCRAVLNTIDPSALSGDIKAVYENLDKRVKK